MAQHATTMPKVQLTGVGEVGASNMSDNSVPRLWGMPLKYISLFTLALQNASLAIIMHYSRVSTAPSKSYSAATAVLLNELLKGFISLAIAFSRIDEYSTRNSSSQRGRASVQAKSGLWHIFFSRLRKLGKEVFSSDCWKLSIPAILYVIQNNLQYVAASNLEAATFQVSYQMKILTTAGFSVLLLRRRLNSTKWIALISLAIGVGIVQIQAGSGNARTNSSMHIMHPFTGFMAVIAACFTSGLAGVYFEMVLKGSHADLWVRNVQLSLFSLFPALLPVLALISHSPPGSSWLSIAFANFGGWAWVTVAIQVFGGLVTAVVIKYSDNILKGFATSLSIVISFLASIVIFDFHITPSFVLGSSTVLAATWLYNRPENRDGAPLQKFVAGVVTPRKTSYPGSPIEPDAPILGEINEKRRDSFGGSNTSASPHLLSAALKLVTPRSSQENLAGHNETLDNTSNGGLGAYSLSRNGSSASLGGFHSSPYLSRAHSPSLTPPINFPPPRSIPGVTSSQSQLTVPSVSGSGRQLRHQPSDGSFSVISSDEGHVPSQR